MAQIPFRARRKNLLHRVTNNLEGLEPRLLLAADFGDAPSPYPTLLIEDGAMHETGGTLTLGAQIDSEADGAHSLAANADGADEDGATFGTIMAGALEAEVTVNVQGGPGKLDAWLDFNGDGNWGGPGEQIFASTSVVEGDNALSFDVPSWARLGETYARFRLSTEGSLGPKGAAPDGEVEDYLVTITPPTRSSGHFGSERTITSGDVFTDQLIPADLDRNGAIDFVASSYRGIIWYKNNDNQHFTSHTISVPGGFSTAISVADLDGDGNLDLLSATQDAIYWHRNNGAQEFTAQELTTASHIRSLATADMDGDGDLDLLGASSHEDDDRISWYENDGSQNFVEHLVSTNTDSPRRVSAVDIDGDGDMDLLVTSLKSNPIAWYENDGNQNFAIHTIQAGFYHPRQALAIDLDLDGDIDVLGLEESSGQIIWYENDGNQSFSPRVIASNVNQTISIFAADLDGDQDIDVLSGSQSNGKIVWYENDGHQGFVERLVTDHLASPELALAADIDGDGDLDVVAVSDFFADDKLVWYENFSQVYDFTKSSFTANEGDSPHTNGSVTLTRSGILNVATSVDVLLTAKTATADEDFLTEPVRVEFGIGETRMDVSLPLLGDTIVESHETIALSLINPTFGSGAGQEQPTATLIIIDNDFGLGDTGDAPFPYPTTLAEDGARHIATGPTLGPTRDSETNGTHSGFATADGVDEDGITFDTVMVGTLDAMVLVNVQGSSGKLDAWLDFDGDGNWGGPGEQIFDNTSVVQGDNALSFDVPSWARLGETYARFRLSTEGSLGPKGAAPDGEVEDYLVTIHRPPESGRTFTEHIVPSSIGISEDLFAADIDADGDVDLISRSRLNSTIAWYENDGEQNFVEHLIATRAYAVENALAADIDGDGDLDILGASPGDNAIAWYENDGNQVFTPHTITASARSNQEVSIADLDGDGDLDILSTSFGDSKIFWWENDGHQNFTPQTISANLNGAHDVSAADVDGDGDLDLLSASSTDDKIAWYENDGQQTFTTHVIATDADGAFDVSAVDLDGDGDMDVLSSLSEGWLTWYENDGNQNFSEQIVTSAHFGASCPVSAFAADMDGDGDVDLLSASRHTRNVVWYENDGKQNFTYHFLATGVTQAWSVFAADIDGDGDLDVVSQTNRDNAIAWHENSNPKYDFSAPAFFADEGDVSRSLSTATLTRSVVTSITSSVDVILTGDSATEGEDFVAGPITVVFEPGEKNLSVPIELLGDLAAESHETIVLSLANFSHRGKAGSSHATATLTIVDDDPALRDFGDAPAPYPTTLAQDGARHAATGPTLGTARVSEPDGTQSTPADGDHGDDDGVTFGMLAVGASQASVTVNVQGGPGRLDAWVDFNRDGNWGGTGERIFNAMVVNEGDNHLSFNVPRSAVSGETYARFRLSTAGGLGMKGLAADGEVEDYQVMVNPPVISSGQFAAPQTFRADDTLTVDIDIAADIDGDGDMDLIADYVRDDDNSLVWYENDGSENFTTHEINVSTVKTRSFSVVDFNGDGQLDILGSSFSGGMNVWYEYNDNQTFIEHVLFANVDDVTWTSTEDIDNDGDMDMLLVRNSEDASITWLENIGAGQLVKRTIASVVGDAGPTQLVDFDADGDMDIIIRGGSIGWLENDGNGDFTEHEIESDAYGGYTAIPADLDNDGDIDLIHADPGTREIIWHNNNGSQEFTRHILVTGFTGWGFRAADLDGDGDLDFVNAAPFSGITSWYENDGNQSFSEHSIVTGNERVRGLSAVDMDGDGDLDLFGTVGNFSDSQNVWLENLEIAYNFTSPAYTVVERDDLHTAQVVTLMRTGAIQSASSVDVIFTGNTATAGEDFVAELVTVEFAAGSTSAVVPIQLQGDTVLESHETLTLSLTNFVSGEGNGTKQPTAVLQIQDDDFALGDLGDAPLPYPTTLAEDGARHTATGPTLGAMRDSEANGTHSPAADADGADEDGVTFGTIMVGALGAEVTVNVQGGPGKLDAWIDFNGDGSWGSAGEQIFDTTTVTEGDNLLSFNVPSWAVAGETYARFRLSTTGDLGFQGAAHDGEVEDYLAAIIPSASRIGIFGPARPIQNLSGVHFTTDIDNDGDIDLLDTSSQGIVWYENNGNGEFEPHTIPADSASVDVFAVDLDGDGDIDVLSILEDGKVAWHENNGQQEFTTHVIAANSNRTYFGYISAADIDSDGDIDVLSSGTPDRLNTWYENDGNEQFAAHPIDLDSDYIDEVFLNDVDRDGDIDILSGVSYPGHIVWHQNDGNWAFSPRVLANTPPGNGSIRSADLNGDGNLDIIGSSTAKAGIAWYENDGSEDFSEHVIDNEADAYGGYSLLVADLDGDGDSDIIIGASVQGDGIAWYENNSHGEFTKHTVDANTYLFGSSRPSVADVDGDGDLDILGRAGDRSEFAWYENLNQVYEFSAASYTTGEDDTPHSTNIVTVTRAGVTDVATSVDVVLTGETATADEDFVAGPITVEFAADQTSADVPIQLLGGVELEPHETLSLSFANFSNGGGNGETHPTALLTILDDDLGLGDLGDAPLPYPTTIAQDGARHVATGPTLGASRDSETNGIPSQTARADGDDEDGITFGTIAVGATQATLTANVQGGDAKLDGWIDFDGDGRWDGPNEQIFDSVAVSEGVNQLSFDVPSTAVAGDTFARFRLSTSGDLQTQGLAEDGEVEDYRVSILQLDNSAARCGGIHINEEIALSLAFFDAGMIDDRSVTVDWGDGQITSGSIAEGVNVGQALASHRYPEPGWYDVTMTVLDPNGSNQTFVTGALVTDSTTAGYPSAVMARFDLDRDQRIGFGDLAIFSSDFLTSNLAPLGIAPTDFDGDGHVGFCDLSIFASTFLQSYNTADLLDSTLNSFSANAAESPSLADTQPSTTTHASTYPASELSAHDLSKPFNLRHETVGLRTQTLHPLIAAEPPAVDNQELTALAPDYLSKHDNEAHGRFFRDLSSSHSHLLDNLDILWSLSEAQQEEGLGFASKQAE